MEVCPMTVISGVDLRLTDGDDIFQPGEIPADLDGVEVLEPDGYDPSLRIPTWGRRAIVIVMGLILIGVAASVLVMTYLEGSWWYTYESDQALDAAARARVVAVRDEVNALGDMPEVVAWLNVALNPDAHPTDVRTSLMVAQQALQEAGDPHLMEAVFELREVIQSIRGDSLKPTTADEFEPKLAWPW
jgi:hypothetical protein